MNPVYRTRRLRSENNNLRSEQDRQVQSCILQHVPRRCHKNHPNLGGYFYSVDHRFSRAQRALFDGTRGKRAIFLCNEVETRGRKAFTRRRRNLLEERREAPAIRFLRNRSPHRSYDSHGREAVFSIVRTGSARSFSVTKRIHAGAFSLTVQSEKTT